MLLQLYYIHFFDRLDRCNFILARMVVNLRFDEWCSVVTVVFLPEFSTLCSQPVVLRCSKLHVLAHSFIFGQLLTFQPSLVFGVRGPAQNRGRVGSRARACCDVLVESINTKLARCRPRIQIGSDGSLPNQSRYLLKGFLQARIHSQLSIATCRCEIVRR
jgi:hypothetical protein